MPIAAPAYTRLASKARRDYRARIDRLRERFGLKFNPDSRPGRLWHPSPDANRPWTPEEIEMMLAKASRPVALMVAIGAVASQREGDAVLGHRTSAMVRHYTRRARQTELADAAMTRLENEP